MTAGRVEHINPAWTHFGGAATGEGRLVPIELRSDVSSSRHASVVRELRSVAWSELEQAYGPADEVPAQLYAVLFGTDPVRDQAWGELWGNIHHQGTVYSATPPALPFLAAVVGDPRHPDRVNAVCFLWAVAFGDGRAAEATRAAAAQEVASLVEGWKREPELVQRALLLLASAFPDLLARHPTMTDVLSDHLRPAWDQLVAAGGDVRRLELPSELMDLQDELEGWAFEGGGPSGRS